MFEETWCSALRLKHFFTFKCWSTFRIFSKTKNSTKCTKWYIKRRSCCLYDKMVISAYGSSHKKNTMWVVVLLDKFQAGERKRVFIEEAAYILRH